MATPTYRTLPGKEPIWERYGRKSHPAEKKDQHLTKREQDESTKSYVLQRIAGDGTGVLGPFTWDDFTGTRPDRDGYQAVLERCREHRRAGHPTYLVIRQLDRFGRDGEELFRAWKEFATIGVEVHAVDMRGPIPPSVFPYLVGNAVVGSILIGANIRRTNEQIRRDGWWRPGRRPFGYQIRKATPSEVARGAPKVVLEEHPTEAEHAREAFTMAASGCSLGDIAKRLTSLGYRNRKGQFWDRQAVYNLLHSPTYIGKQSDGAPGNWPAIVTAADQERALGKLRRHAQRPHQAGESYLLTGFLFCECGARMRGAGGASERRYRCNDVTCNRVSGAKAIETAVLARIGPMVATSLTVWERFFRQVAEEEARESVGASGTPLADITARIASLEAEGANLARKLASGQIEQWEYDGAIAQIRQDRATAVQTRDALRAAQPARAERLTAETILQDVRRLADQWATGDVQLQRDTLDQLVLRVVPVRDGRTGYTINAHVDFTPLGETLNAALGAMQRA